MKYGGTTATGKRRARWIVACVAAVALACALWCAWNAARVEAEAQSAVSVRTAVMDAALQCAAVEGAYPASLEYLEEHYGLIVNRADYVVTYEAFASNVPPSVVVMPR